MIALSISSVQYGSNTNRVLIIPVHNTEQNTYLEELEKHYTADFRRLLADAEFSAKNGSLFSYSVPWKGDFKTIVFVGYALGAQESSTIENVRRALGLAVKHCQRLKLTTLSVHMPDAQYFECSYHYLIEQSIAAMLMASYQFDDFITSAERKTTKIVSIELLLAEQGDFSEAINQGIQLGNAVNQARLWVDLPANKLKPSDMVNHAQRIASECNIVCKVLDKNTVKSLGMGGLAGVAQGSDQDCAFVVLEYKTNDPDAKSLALVGKGITFDSGGLSIKPAAAMESMKDDMAGAAAVMSAMQVLAERNVMLNIVALLPLSENLINGSALKPGDIISFYNGKTAEVRNTDAEGRLILADALAYGVKHYKPDAIIDIATLTGSCAYALGPFFAGLMSKDQNLIKYLMDAGQRSGDRVWALPFTDDYKPAVRSSVADLCNIGSPKYKAGAITAGFFLQEFVDDTPWAHLDIAGVGFEVPDCSYSSSGATGFGVRLLVDFALHWSTQK